MGLAPKVAVFFIFGTFACAILAAGPFTAEQSTAGRNAYQANCESCHLPDLTGRNEAPPLAGSNFIGTWGNRSTRDLIGFIQTTMPPGNAGGLGQQTYVAIAAFLLDANGAEPGDQRLTATTDI